MIDNPAWWQKALDHYGIEDTQMTDTDIVTRLRGRIHDPEIWNALVDDAADEIERLRAEVIRLRAGLEKIAAEPSIAAAIRKGTND